MCVRDIDHSPFTYKASRGELLNDKTKTAIQTVYEIQVVVGIPLLKHLLSEKNGNNLRQMLREI